MSQDPETKQRTASPGTAPAQPDGNGNRAHRPDPGGAGSEKQPREVGGRKGPDPTRYGDWEKNGRCIDF